MCDEIIECELCHCVLNERILWVITREQYGNEPKTICQACYEALPEELEDTVI